MTTRRILSMQRLVVLSLVAALLPLAMPTPALADVTCPDVPLNTGAVSFGAVTIADDLVVPARATCQLEGTTVTGDVVVETDAVLDLIGATVRGNVEAEEYDSIIIEAGSEVGGEVEATDGTNVVLSDSRIRGRVEVVGQSGTVISTIFILNTTIGGKLVVTENMVDIFRVDFNTIAGDLEVEDNTAQGIISGNVIGGNLECAGNDPDPTGGNNEVGGEQVGECAVL